MPAPPFSEFDARLEGVGTDLDLLYYKGEKRRTAALKLRPTRQDTGANENQLRPEYGDYFAQNRFDGGQGQEYFHDEAALETMIYASEGLDFSGERVKALLRTKTMALTGAGGGFTAAGGGRNAQIEGALFIVAGPSDIRRTADLIAFTDEDPHDLDPTTDIYDITTRGNEGFAALGANGIHRRAPGGIWAHWQPDGATDLNVGDARLVAFVKDRIMVAGDGGRVMYEVTASSAPPDLFTLPTGWTFTEIGESGQYIYATAVCVAAGLSRVHVFGLDAAAALEHKGSTALPKNQFAYSVRGYLDAVFIGGGILNEDGGYDPVIYLSTPLENGLLKFAKIAEGEGAGALDLSVKAIYPDGEQIFFGWSLGADAPFGTRTGIAVYDLVKGAFFHHQGHSSGTAKTCTGITRYGGSLLWIPDVLIYEAASEGYRVGDVNQPTWLITSIADWHSAGPKVWDLYDIRHSELLPNTSIQVSYTLQHPKENNFTVVGTSDVDGAEGMTFRETDIIGRQLAVKFAISTNIVIITNPPELESFSVRSVPTAELAEFTLERFIRLIPHDRKSSQSPEKYIEPDNVLGTLRGMLRSFRTLYEEDGTWDVWIDDFAEIIPGEPLRDVDDADVTDDSYVVKLTMIGTEL